MIRRLTLLLWLALPSPALPQISSVRSAFQVTPSPASAYGQHNPRLAYDGTGTYLAVWEEGAYVWPNSMKQIYAARIQMRNGTPTPLDPSGIHVSSSSYNQDSPRIAGNRSGTFLVVWQQFNGTDYDIKGATVTSAGAVSSPISICTQPHNQITPDVTYDSVNRRFFVVWADFRDNANYRIYGAKIAIDGTVAAIANPILDYTYHYGDPYANTTKDAYVPYTPAVAANGSHIVVTFSDIGRLRPGADLLMANRYTLDGTYVSTILGSGDNGSDSSVKVQTNFPFYTVGHASQTAVLTDGTNFLALFRNIGRGTIGHTFDTYFAQTVWIKSDGTVPNKPQDNIDHNYMAPSSAGVYVAPYYYIFWQGIAASADSWQGKATGGMDYNIYCARVDATTGHVVSTDYASPTTVSNSSYQELEPAAATDGSNILVVYGEDTNSTWVLKGRLLSTTASNPPSDRNPTNLTSFQLTSTNSGTLPFTVGLAFKDGDVAGTPALDLANYQINVTRRWNDGSVKTAIASGTATLSANTPLTVHVSNVGTLPGGTNLTCSNVASAIASAGTTSIQFGSLGTLNLASLTASPFRTWFAGPQAVECHYRGTLGDLIAWFYVRLYASGRMWVRVVVENGYIDTDAKTQTYSPKITLGGAVIYTNGGSNLTHYAMSRWTVDGWIGGDPAITPKHDTAYLVSTKLVPNYHWKNPASSALAGTYVIDGTYNGLRTFSYAPMQHGDWYVNMTAPGFHIDIGLLPLWDALYITSGADPRAYASMIANSKALNTYTIALNYSGSKLPLSPENPVTSPGHTAIGSGGPVWEIAHHGSGGYLAYLVTGDYFYLLTMQGQAATVFYCYNYGYGDNLHRDFLGGGLQETRAVAWTVRTVSQLTAVGPAGDPVTAAYQTLLSNNINNWKTMVDSFGGSGLGYLYAYEVPHKSYGLGIVAPWQQHFWIAAMGMGSDIQPLPNMANFNAVRDWMYKGVVGILGSDGSTGYCYSQASPYTMTVTNNSSSSPASWYQTWSQVSPNGWTRLTSCGTSLLPTDDSSSDPEKSYDGYWGNLLPAIAYAVDHNAPGAAAAWGLITGATNFSRLTGGYAGNGNFNDVPIWGVVPRSYQK